MTDPRPWSRRAPEAPARGWDTIVIGSGMGGMTCAAILARLGERVLVLEQHYVPGGFTHSFRRGADYHWDVGVHAVGEVSERSLTGRLLHALTDGRLQWRSLGPVYDEFDFPGGLHLEFPDDPRQFRDNLAAAFPAQLPAIDAYLQRVRDVAGAMKRYYLARILPTRSGGLAEALLAAPARRAFAERTADVLAQITDDERLRSVLVAQWAYHGSPPSRSSFAIQALVTKHFLYGGYYPVGGSQRIAGELLRTVADAGGWTRIAADVERILIADGAAVGVRLRDGEELRARRVVSAAGARATVERLLPPEFAARAWVASIRNLPPAPAHVCLYLGFKGDIRRAGAGPANKWFYETWDTEQDAWRIDHVPEDRPPDAPVLYCSFPSLKDPAHDPGPEQRHTGEVVTFVPWDRFAGWLGTRWHKRGADYAALKDALQERLLAQFLAKMPGLRGMIDHVELSTPLSTDHFVRPVRGSIYGLEPTPARFANPHLRPHSPVPGLLLAGSDVATVGVIGAMMGGVLAAAAAQPRRVLGLLRGLGRSPAPAPPPRRS
jgi:all-trans-retinol 13,14-reductase